tara:strand:- start:162 stop:884 length:723 start_codon:yes stop_codon:yes gene_type:complete
MNQGFYSVSNNKVLVIVGGKGRLGQSFEQHFKSKEWNTVVLDKPECDINNPRLLSKSIKDIHSKFNKIDAVINAAYPKNKNYGKKFFDVDLNDFNENVNLHLGGYFLVMQKFAEYFAEQGGGNIVNISSIYGVTAPKFEIYKELDMTVPVEYAAIKSAVIHLTKYLAKYLKSKNIRVNCISPGGILDSQPESFLKEYKEKCINKGMLDAKDLNSALDFLLSNRSQFVNGQNIVIDDGFTL